MKEKQGQCTCLPAIKRMGKEDKVIKQSSRVFYIHRNKRKKCTEETRNERNNMIEDNRKEF